MGKAIPYDYRVKIVQRIKSGQSYQEVSQAFGYSESGIKKLWYSYKKPGETVLQTKYSNCGSSSPYGEAVRNKVAELRDNEQGSTYIYSKLKEKYPQLPTPSARTLNRWWVKEQTNRPKGRPKEEEKKHGAKNLIILGK
ncbi:MAG: helix-turn-helix domain-containing protein [Cyanobacteria bacterium P01_D01_bin.116]